MTGSIFVSNNAASTNSTRQLDGTARLTSFANSLAAKLVREFADSEDDEKQAVITKAFTDTASLDLMVDAANESITEDCGWMSELDDELLDKMLKSQQSKRSRCKSKEMTQDNFTSMLSAAIAERAIRLALGKPKGNSSTQRRGARYTDEDIQKLADDQEALKKAIRNIQSKKSIMKSKAGFDETAPEYQELLEDEEKLKAVRIGGGHVDVTKQAVRQLLTDVDINSLKAADAKDLLHKILGVTAPDQTESASDDQTADEADNA